MGTKLGLHDVITNGIVALSWSPSLHTEFLTGSQFTQRFYVYAGNNASFEVTRYNAVCRDESVCNVTVSGGTGVIGAQPVELLVSHSCYSSGKSTVLISFTPYLYPTITIAYSKHCEGTRIGIDIMSADMSMDDIVSNGVVLPEYSPALHTAIVRNNQFTWTWYVLSPDDKLFMVMLCLT